MCPETMACEPKLIPYCGPKDICRKISADRNDGLECMDYGDMMRWRVRCGPKRDTKKPKPSISLSVTNMIARRLDLLIKPR